MELWLVGPGLPDWLTPHALWRGLGWPLMRLSFFISLGLVIANIIEALNWTRSVARLAAPVIRRAHLPDVSGASFSMAFFPAWRPIPCCPRPLKKAV